ncbi:unnamed protein product [Ranitomeya imitator]|uniref:XRN2-binding (XTBD) domain-containing protein n=1 Tax=Ranitomeya imitator TaxID=111125 RepID=A0ABN9L3I1_9NEOB|nr:unnamed protein product [Ranitomeya imitator]
MDLEVQSTQSDLTITKNIGRALRRFLVVCEHDHTDLFTVQVSWWFLGGFLVVCEHDHTDLFTVQKMAAEFVRGFQSYSESDKQWRARKEFLLQNLERFQGENEMDKLLALSMVWANHVFMGCRYSDELLERVQSMAEGIEVEDAPHFTTRDEIMKRVCYLINLMLIHSCLVVVIDVFSFTSESMTSGSLELIFFLSRTLLRSQYFFCWDPNEKLISCL